jgi:hypothetical protein
VIPGDREDEAEPGPVLVRRIGGSLAASRKLFANAKVPATQSSM